MQNHWISLGPRYLYIPGLIPIHSAQVRSIEGCVWARLEFPHGGFGSCRLQVERKDLATGSRWWHLEPCDCRSNLCHWQVCGCIKAYQKFIAPSVAIYVNNLFIFFLHSIRMHLMIYILYSIYPDSHPRFLHRRPKQRLLPRPRREALTISWTASRDEPGFQNFGMWKVQFFL